MIAEVEWVMGLYNLAVVAEVRTTGNPGATAELGVVAAANRENSYDPERVVKS